MKRDMDLVRRILLAVEQHDAFDGVPYIEALAIDDERFDVTVHHVDIMVQAGLLKVTALGVSLKGEPGKPDRFGIKLTWTGSEFLDATRSATVWNKVKTTLVASGGAATFDIILDLAKSYLKSAVGVGS